jgi:hypothetical protein
MRDDQAVGGMEVEAFGQAAPAANYDHGASAQTSNLEDATTHRPCVAQA